MAIKISGTTVIDNSQNITNAGIVTATSFTGDGSQLTNLPGGGGNTLEATASGTLADGSKVIINTDGTVSVVAQTETTGPGAGTPAVFESATVRYVAPTFDSANGKVVIAYRDDGNSDYGTAVVGTVSGTSISFGTPVVFESATTNSISTTFDSASGKVVIAYQDAGNSNRGTAIVGTVSGTSISFGSPTVFETSSTSAGDFDISLTFDSANGKVVIAYRDGGNSSYGTAIVGTVSGTSISFGSATVFYQGNTQYITSTFDSTNNKVIIAYSDRQGGSDYRGKAIVGTVSGTSISFGSAAQINSARADALSATYDSSNEKVVIAFNDHTSGSGYGTAIVGTVSGTSISFGSSVVFNSASSLFNTAAYDSANGKVVISYRDNGNSAAGTAIVGTVSGTSISFGSSIVVESDGSLWNSAVYDSTNQKVVIAYSDDGNSSYGTAAVFGQTGFSSVPQIGTAVVFEVGPSYPNTSTFDSSTGKVVIAYKDLQDSGYGKAIVGTVSGTSISFGSPVTFENSQQILNPEIAFDSSSNKVVIIYSIYNNMYGHGIVGTVSGDTITFGSSTTFTNYYYNSAAVVFDSSNNKIVAIGKDESNSTGVCYVGTVSGTSISFGSKVTYKNSNLYQMKAIFDSSNNKVVIGYQDSTNGNKGAAIVGTVSGTSISFGSAVVFTGSNVLNYPLTSTFDSSNNKVIFAYRDSGNSSYGAAVVGTVSGTSISFGTPVVFSSAQAFYISATFDSSNNQVIIAYSDSGNSYYGTAVAGTVSGTSISFGSPSVFESANTNYIESTFDSTNNKAIFSYRDDGNGDSGTAVTFSPRTISNNLTSENFIGISDGAYSDGQTATIQLTGAVDDAQSSLTPGQSYYVQNDGTLSETADNPSVFAGTALASTKLIVRG